MKTYSSLIIGFGEVGKALYEVLSVVHQVDFIDKDDKQSGTYDILHICFPYSEHFIKAVKNYQKKYKPQFTIIHSTVPIGTSRKCNAIHSPVIGIHPNLVSGIKTFTKYLGGEQASKVANYFRRADIKIYLYDKPETTELMKVLCTTFYGVCIEYTKEVKRMCDKYGIPFEAWTLWTENYNQGYQKLGHSEFTRPNLIPIMGVLEGHCLLPNCDLLKSRFTDLVKQCQ